VSCAPHDPGRGSCEGTGEGQHLDTSVSLECGVRNDAVLDRVCCSGSDGDGSQHLEDGTENHCLPVGDRPRGDTGRPGVCNIVYPNNQYLGRRAMEAKLLTCSIVVSIEHGKESANHENVGVLVQHLEEQSSITQETISGSGC
jgi:hypothetical protein